MDNVIYSFENMFRILDGASPDRIQIRHTMDFVNIHYHNSNAVRRGVSPPTDPIDLTNINTVVEVRSRINCGRWIVDCVSAVCNGAECADLENPYFMCCTCWNGEFGNPGTKWLEVISPPKEDREEIEKVLLARPIKFRNWFPGETVQQLIEENKTHGFPEGV